MKITVKPSFFFLWDFFFLSDKILSLFAAAHRGSISRRGPLTSFHRSLSSFPCVSWVGKNYMKKIFFYVCIFYCKFVYIFLYISEFPKKWHKKNIRYLTDLSFNTFVVFFNWCRNPRWRLWVNQTKLRTSESLNNSDLGNWFVLETETF